MKYQELIKAVKNSNIEQKAIIDITKIIEDYAYLTHRAGFAR